MNDDLIRHVADVTAAYVAHNHIRAEELGSLITAVHGAFIDLDRPQASVADKPKPAVDLPWKKTIKPDYLISLVDGRQYKTLRRHLSVNGLTPDEYRARYDLPRDYPMVAASYSEQRSALALSFGLGRQDQAVAAAEPSAEPDASEPQVAEAVAAADPATVPAKVKRGRLKKAVEAA